MKSWKTTASGIVAIATGMLFAFSQYLGGGFAAISWEALIAAVTAGVGLIFAKDSNVSNSPTPGAAVKVPPSP